MRLHPLAVILIALWPATMAALAESPSAPITPPVVEEAETTTDAEPGYDVGAPQLRDFAADEIGLVLRVLARQAKANIIVSDRVAAEAGTVTMRLEGKTARETIDIVVQSKGLVLEELDGVIFIKTQEEYARVPYEVELDRITAKRVPAMARLKGEYFRQLVAAGTPEQTASELVLRETMSVPNEQVASPGASTSRPSSVEFWHDFDSIAWASIGLGVVALLIAAHLALLHCILAIAVWLEARRVRRDGKRLVFFGPFFWTVATLMGGFFSAGMFWLAHHSSLRAERAMAPAVPA